MSESARNGSSSTPLSSTRKYVVHIKYPKSYYLSYGWMVLCDLSFKVFVTDPFVGWWNWDVRVLL
jgi:hypothetical protein